MSGMRAPGGLVCEISDMRLMSSVRFDNQFLVNLEGGNARWRHHNGDEWDQAPVNGMTLVVSFKATGARGVEGLAAATEKVSRQLRRWEEQQTALRFATFDRVSVLFDDDMVIVPMPPTHPFADR